MCFGYVCVVIKIQSGGGLEGKLEVKQTHHEICEHLLQLQQCGLVFDVLSVLRTQTHRMRIYTLA